MKYAELFSRKPPSIPPTSASAASKSAIIRAVNDVRGGHSRHHPREQHQEAQHHGIRGHEQYDGYCRSRMSRQECDAGQIQGRTDGSMHAQGKDNEHPGEQDAKMDLLLPPKLIQLRGGSEMISDGKYDNHNDEYDDYNNDYNDYNNDYNDGYNGYGSYDVNYDNEKINDYDDGVEYEYYEYEEDDNGDGYYLDDDDYVINDFDETDSDSFEDEKEKGEAGATPANRDSNENKVGFNLPFINQLRRSSNKAQSEVIVPTVSRDIDETASQGTKGQIGTSVREAKGTTTKTTRRAPLSRFPSILRTTLTTQLPKISKLTSGAAGRGVRSNARERSLPVRAPPMARSKLAPQNSLNSFASSVPAITASVATFVDAAMSTAANRGSVAIALVMLTLVAKPYLARTVNALIGSTSKGDEALSNDVIGGHAVNTSKRNNKRNVKNDTRRSRRGNYTNVNFVDNKGMNKLSGKSSDTLLSEEAQESEVMDLDLDDAAYPSTQTASQYVNKKKTSRSTNMNILRSLQRQLSSFQINRNGPKQRSALEMSNQSTESLVSNNEQTTHDDMNLALRHNYTVDHDLSANEDNYDDQTNDNRYDTADQKPHDNSSTMPLRQKYDALHEAHQILEQEYEASLRMLHEARQQLKRQHDKIKRWQQYQAQQQKQDQEQQKQSSQHQQKQEEEQQQLQQQKEKLLELQSQLQQQLQEMKEQRLVMREQMEQKYQSEYQQKIRQTEQKMEQQTQHKMREELKQDLQQELRKEIQEEVQQEMQQEIDAMAEMKAQQRVQEELKNQQQLQEDLVAANAQLDKAVDEAIETTRKEERQKAAAEMERVRSTIQLLLDQERQAMKEQVRKSTSDMREWALRLLQKEGPDYGGIDDVDNGMSERGLGGNNVEQTTVDTLNVMDERLDPRFESEPRDLSGRGTKSRSVPGDAFTQWKDDQSHLTEQRDPRLRRLQQRKQQQREKEQQEQQLTGKTQQYRLPSGRNGGRDVVGAHTSGNVRRVRPNVSQGMQQSTLGSDSYLKYRRNREDALDSESRDSHKGRGGADNGIVARPRNTGQIGKNFDDKALESYDVDVNAKIRNGRGDAHRGGIRDRNVMNKSMDRGRPLPRRRTMDIRDDTPNRNINQSTTNVYTSRGMENYTAKRTNANSRAGMEVDDSKSYRSDDNYGDVQLSPVQRRRYPSPSIQGRRTAEE